jgi:hypothetical protein
MNCFERSSASLFLFPKVLKAKKGVLLSPASPSCQHAATIVGVDLASVE